MAVPLDSELMNKANTMQIVNLAAFIYVHLIFSHGEIKKKRNSQINKKMKQNLSLFSKVTK